MSTSFIWKAGITSFPLLLLSSGEIGMRASISVDLLVLFSLRSWRDIVSTGADTDGRLIPLVRWVVDIVSVIIVS